MPPKAQFSKEIILNTAFKILKSSGWGSVTARNIAGDLGASTQPIYSYLKNMDDLTGELRLMALESMSDFQVKGYTDNPFVNMAVGYVLFAQAEKNLFSFLYNEKPLMHGDKNFNAESKWLSRRIEEKSGNKFDVTMFTGKISADNMDELALNSWIYIHGLAVLLSSGALRPMKEKKIIELVEGEGQAFYMKTQLNQK